MCNRKKKIQRQFLVFVDSFLIHLLLTVYILNINYKTIPLIHQFMNIEEKKLIGQINKSLLQEVYNVHFPCTCNTYFHLLLYIILFCYKLIHI